LVKTLKKSWSKSIFYIDNSLYLCENKIALFCDLFFLPKKLAELTTSTARHCPANPATNTMKVNLELCLWVMSIQEISPNSFIVNCRLCRRDMEDENKKLLREHFTDDEISKIQEELCRVLIGLVTVTSHQIALPVPRRI
jgi:hypothetical protein